jgi:tetratricopeptide (TPR) repeat protein
MEQLTAARQIFTEHKARPELARTLLELGQLYHQYQDFEGAYAHLRDALRLFQKLEDEPGQAATQEALGNLLLQVGRVTEAGAYLHAARHYYATQQQEQRLQEVDELLEIVHEAQEQLRVLETTP